MTNKTQIQVLKLLKHYSENKTPGNNTISSFLKESLGVCPAAIIYSDLPDSPTISPSDFINWYEHGFGASDIARHDTEIVCLGDCDTERAHIIGSLENQAIKTCSRYVLQTDLRTVSQEEAVKFYKQMLGSRLQFNADFTALEEKYLPKDGEKIIFHTHNRSETGLGIVRNLDVNKGEIELYCYFIYPSAGTDRKIGYSMHENKVINLYNYCIEPMMSDRHRITQMDGMSCYKRLARELKKENKVWKDKLNRIEPSELPVIKGEYYWYINDKLRVVKTVEKDTSGSHSRRISGNRFDSYEAAVKVQEAFKDIIQRYLASPDWPEIKI